MITDAATRMPVLELSIGDYVLAGGEVATMVMIEAITRLIPGVLGNPDSAGEDSFSGELTGLLEAPSYTRPPVYRGIPVPAVLTSGDHGAVAAYRRAESLRRTESNRPDLLDPARPAEPLFSGFGGRSGTMERLPSADLGRVTVATTRARCELAAFDTC